MIIQKLPIPSKDDWRLYSEVLTPGTPILYKYQENTHLFNALVQECGPYILTITNGHTSSFIEVTQVLTGDIEIQLMNDPEQPIIAPCKVFDTEKIPSGSIYMDQYETSFIIKEAEPFSITLVDYKNETHYVNAQTFFGLDADEIEDCSLIIPPVLQEGVDADNPR